MDMVVVDTGDDRLQLGEPVVLFGRGTDGEPTVADWADWAGTIEHEIVTRIGSRVSRVQRTSTTTTTTTTTTTKQEADVA